MMINDSEECWMMRTKFDWHETFVCNKAINPTTSNAFDYGLSIWSSDYVTVENQHTSGRFCLELQSNYDSLMTQPRYILPQGLVPYSKEVWQRNAGK